MKKLLIILPLLSLMFVPLVQAEHEEVEDGCGSHLEEFLNECDPSESNTENGDEAGLGADLVLHKSDNPDSVYDETTVEYRYDFKSSNQTTYGVVKLNLWNAIKGFFNR